GETFAAFNTGLVDRFTADVLLGGELLDRSGSDAEGFAAGVHGIPVDTAVTVPGLQVPLPIVPGHSCPGTAAARVEAVLPDRFALVESHPGIGLAVLFADLGAVEPCLPGCGHAVGHRG